LRLNPPGCASWLHPRPSTLPQPAFLSGRLVSICLRPVITPASLPSVKPAHGQLALTGSDAVLRFPPVKSLSLAVVDSLPRSPHSCAMVASAAQSILPAKRRNNGVVFRGEIGMAKRAMVQRLYLTSFLSAQQIAKEVKGLTANQVSTLCHREGWTEQRRTNLAKNAASISQRASDSLAKIYSAVAVESEELIFSGLNRARESVKSKGKFSARDFQSWSGGIRNFADISRKCRGIDRADTIGAGSNGNVNLSLFVMPESGIRPMPRDVTPGAPGEQQTGPATAQAVDVVATPTAS